MRYGRLEVQSEHQKSGRTYFIASVIVELGGLYGLIMFVQDSRHHVVA